MLQNEAMSARTRVLGHKHASSSRPAQTSEEKQQLLEWQMDHELDRLTATSALLETSSATIGGIFAANQDFRTRMSRAAQALGLLRRRVERDQRFVLCAFYFMLASAVYVLARRTGMVRLGQTMAGWWMAVGPSQGEGQVGEEEL